MTFLIFIIVLAIAIFIVVYRSQKKVNAYKFISDQVGYVYDKYAPYSYKMVREKVKELGQEYTTRQYITQVGVFAAAAAILSFLYFYNVVISLIYAVIAVAVIPYLSYLRCKRLYSEFIFEQIQVYTTNTIMEFQTTQSFVKALEGVYSSGVLEDPVKSDVKTMIDMAYENGTVEQSVDFFNAKYDYYIVRNMHQLFIQITNEGSRDAGQSLENMSQDIDMLVEAVYRDRLDRSEYYKKFLRFGIMLYLMIMLVQILISQDSYIEMLDSLYVQILLHIIVLINSFFILDGVKYYNEDVGAE